MDGNHDWMKEDMPGDLMTSILEPQTTLVGSAENAGAVTQNWKFHALVSDDRTEQDVRSDGRPAT
jgi:hypothetical protein